MKKEYKEYFYLAVILSLIICCAAILHSGFEKEKTTFVELEDSVMPDVINGYYCEYDYLPVLVISYRGDDDNNYVNSKFTKEEALFAGAERLDSLEKLNSVKRGSSSGVTEFHSFCLEGKYFYEFWGFILKDKVYYYIEVTSYDKFFYNEEYRVVDDGLKISYKFNSVLFLLILITLLAVVSVLFESLRRELHRNKKRKTQI